MANWRYTVFLLPILIASFIATAGESPYRVIRLHIEPEPRALVASASQRRPSKALHPSRHHSTQPARWLRRRASSLQVC